MWHFSFRYFKAGEIFLGEIVSGRNFPTPYNFAASHKKLGGVVVVERSMLCWAEWTWAAEVLL